MTHTSGNDDGDIADRSRRHDDAPLAPRLSALDDLKDYDVSDGAADPRGWTVVDAMHADIGKVHDLIVDTAAMRTKYLDVELDKHAARLESDRHVLVPVALAQLDDDHHRVIFGSVAAAQLVALPPYTHDVVDDEYERMLLTSLAPRARETPAANTATTADETRAPDIRRRAEARTQPEPSAPAQSEVVVDRRPVTRADSAEGRELGEDEIRIPVYEDEIVVNTRRVLKEEIIVKKSAVPPDQGNAASDRTKDA